MKAKIAHVSAYTNKNGNPTVSFHIDAENGDHAVIRQSLNGGALEITKQTLSRFGITKAMLGKPNLDIACDVAKVPADVDPETGIPRMEWRFISAPVVQADVADQLFA